MGWETAPCNIKSIIKADDVLYAIVQIVNELGNCVIMEIVDHKPAPEPEPVPINPVEEQTEE